MSRRFALGLDLGGGGGRALLADLESGELFSARRAWTFPVAPGTGGVGYDLEPERLLASLGEALRDALERAGADASQVAGVAATSMRFGLVVVDAAGTVLFATPNRDARAAGENLGLAADEVSALARCTGLWPMPIFAAPRLRWLAAQHPELWSRAHAVLSLSDWIAYRLCGELGSDFSQAGCTGLFDLAAQDWAWDWIDRFELPRELFPPVRAAGSKLGALAPEAAAVLGLDDGTTVVVGGADTQCGLLGCGALSEGDTVLVAGTTAPLQMVLGKPAGASDARLWRGPHVASGRWVLESNAGPVGETLDWVAQLLHADTPVPVAALLAEAGSSEPGAAGQLSTLGAQLFDARAPTLPVGDLTLSHMLVRGDPNARRHLSRAVVEGLAYALRENLDQLRDLSGLEPAELRLGGRLSQSPRLAQLLADVMGIAIVASRTPETSALGAAICAGVGARAFPNLRAGARRLVGESAVYTPNPETHERYDTLLADWQRLRTARAPGDAVAQSLAIQNLLRDAGRAEASDGPQPRPRILVTADLDEESLATLAELGTVEYASFRERMRLLTGDSLVAALEGFEVFVTEVDVVDVAAVARLPDLRVIASCRGDAVNVDVAGMTALGVPVLNAPGRNADAVADLTVAYMLMLARKLTRATEFLRQPGIEAGDMGKMGQAFGTLQGRELWRKTVGLVGFGAVGRGVARRLRPFGARVLAFDPFVDAEQASLLGAESVSLEFLLGESDFVSLHAPVNEHTRGLIGADELGRMKPSAYFVNTARAALVDEGALIDALKGERLAGAAIDVFAVEPPGSDHPLLALDNVIATPHVAGNTVEVASHQGRIIADDLARMLRGERPRHVVAPDALATFSWSEPRPEPDPEELAALARAPGPAVSDLHRPERPEARRQDPGPERGEVPDEILQSVERLMQAFCEGIGADEKLREFAADCDVTLHFVLSDLPCACWLRLRAGTVEAGLGEPDAEPEVQLKMRAYIFDGMFTGGVNAMEKAMSGELSFTGDTAKAMTLQQIQRDLNRLYRAARAEVGDPGDLEALPAPGGAGPSAARPVAAGDVREELVAVVNELYSTQLITATGGNVSVRVPDEDALWITPSQLFKGDLRPEILVRIHAQTGRPLDPDGFSPSSERLMHCAAYRARRDARAVIHAHAAHATILVNAGLPFLPISTEAAFFDEIPRIPFTMPGTQELADAIEEALASSWAVLMQNHGILVAGRSLRRAADMAEIIERSCEVILGCYAVGKEPPVLPPDVVKTLREMGDLVA